MAKGYPPPQEHPPRMLPGMATLRVVPGTAIEVPGTPTGTAYSCEMATRWDATEPPLPSIAMGGQMDPPRYICYSQRG